MCKVCSVGYAGASLAMAVTTVPTSSPTTVDPADYSAMRETVKEIKLPEIEQPAWLKKRLADKAAAERARNGAATAGRSNRAQTVPYSVETNGRLSANVNEFKLLANQTLNDGRGWSRMNVTFKEVASGGMFTLVLAEASKLPTYSSGCSADYSCRAGRYVIINQDRWQGATPSWNSAGGSLRDYRHMVVNHEVGHWLGHGHRPCGGPGQAAPVMQQQSIDLQGCRFNPWPLSSELNSTTLGVL